MPAPSPPLQPAQEQRLLYTLAGIQFTHILDFMIMMPLAPMLTRAFGLSTAQFGLLVSAYTFTAAISALMAAVVVDRFNRRRVVLTLYAGFIVATAACAAAPGYATLLIARGLAGAFGGVLGAMVHTYIGDTIPFERRGRATGVVMAAFSLSTVAGVPLGLLFANHSGALGWRAPFIFAAVLAAIVFAAGLRTLPSIAARTQDLRLSAAFKPMGQVLADANHWRAFAFMVLLMLGGFTVIPYITLYTTGNVGFPETLLPLMYLVGGVCTFFTARWFGRLADQYGKARVFRVIALLSILPILAITHSPALPWWAVILMSTPFFILVSGRFVPGMAMVTSAGKPQVRGTFMSLNSAVQSAGSGLAALIAGLIISRDAQGMIHNYNYVGYVACAATLAAIWLAARVKPVDARPSAAPLNAEAATSS
jgi:predicted MFS family arabinose efflux permease